MGTPINVVAEKARSVVEHLIAGVRVPDDLVKDLATAVAEFEVGQGVYTEDQVTTVQSQPVDVHAFAGVQNAKPEEPVEEPVAEPTTETTTTTEVTTEATTETTQPVTETAPPVEATADSGVVPPVPPAGGGQA